MGYTLEVKPSQIPHEDAEQGLFIHGEADVGIVLVFYPGGKGSERIWKMLNKPLDGTRLGGNHEVLERRNPLAFAHFANHPAKDMVPNVMVSLYDFPLPKVNLLRT
ncbi:hypothetical protein H5410_063198 [Solanum commersonii]|uniref:Uncharacterized protein n=1 Tax=Solanum commersonii TaxID=4109 RepID=A0A9J5WEL0_SOLCO|nr:hypothetical protein H5410_063198 [Solanum commersonii]